MYLMHFDSYSKSSTRQALISPPHLTDRSPAPLFPPTPTLLSPTSRERHVECHSVINPLMQGYWKAFEQRAAKLLPFAHFYFNVNPLLTSAA